MTTSPSSPPPPPTFLFLQAVRVEALGRILVNLMKIQLPCQIQIQLLGRILVNLMKIQLPCQMQIQLLGRILVNLMTIQLPCQKQIQLPCQIKPWQLPRLMRVLEVCLKTSCKPMLKREISLYLCILVSVWVLLMLFNLSARSL
uniref:Uncharacterized protein n=1 Tax=Populus trichocarpa TaxID=3694 RepID=A0A3N7FBE0_POPTR